MKKIILLFLLICTYANAQQAGSSVFKNYDVLFPVIGTEKWESNSLVSISEDIIEPEENSEHTYVDDKFTSEVLQERLAELSLNSPLDVPYNAIVERHIRLYLTQRKDAVSNLMDKALFYFPIFEEYLDKYDLPIELKYLAIVESALEPDAKSVAGAKGLWQFMYHTGLENGLEINSLVDERMDPIRSTEAACKYLRKLYTIFEDWDLVLAAYNSGPGNVQKAIRRSGGLRNYWNIRAYLPQETRGYVPAFYANFYLFNYGKEHQISPKNITITYADTDTVHIHKRLSFTTIAKELPIDLSLLRQLNPQYKSGIIPLKNERYDLRLPKSLIIEYLQKEAKIYGLPEVSSTQRERANYIIPTITNSYVVKEGDNLNSIAKLFQVTTEQLKKWNGLQTNYTIAHQRLVITDKVRQHEKKNTYITYTVKEGESLFLITRLFPGITINQLRSWNNLWNKNYIAPGTQLKILTQTE